MDTAIGHTKNDAPLFAVKRGRTITLGLSNPGAENGFIHLHGHSFRLLDALDDGWKPFWLDTMPVAPGGKARIAFVADDPGKWLIEGWVAPTPGSK
ncbi:MAG: multicopper oxidase domain-containing protein [Xanthobacteraceae bacterium]